jgi:hypothetical protein
MSKPRTVKKRRMEIERKGTRVHFIVECEDEYSAMALYDQSVAEAAAGTMDLTIVTQRARGRGERGSA